MEIVIESDPYRPSSTSPAPTYLRSPVTAVQPHISTNSAFYYATLPRGGGLVKSVVEAPDGAPPGVRRVDKSGLLEIADVEPPRVPATTSRLLATSEGHGTLSRRLDRSGLLEAVPEVPDTNHHQPRTGLASDELMAAAATARSMVERQQHLLGAETAEGFLEAALLRRRTFTDSSLDSSASVQTESEASSGPTQPERTRPRVKFADDEIRELPPPPPPSRRLSPRQLSLSSHVPDVVEAHGNSAPDTKPAVNQTGSGEAPEGERAEAEGCEHTALERVEEPRHSATNAKMGNNDNIQAVHVIILSEQL